MQSLGGAKIMQPLGTKKSRNLKGQKKHATSWDKKIMQPLGKKIIIKAPGTKKITQPTRTKKTGNLLGQKTKSGNLSGQKNHATSWNKIKILRS